ncbi:shikimate dehydrogenase [Thermomicrobium sp. 4228-Ro]|uniref:shikimate dehydrogenase n=1 Tax=Thermomicrobium sp. 4228-Ro TaxID=2993937 RepID=UPI0022487CD1|nr:shikimate dehydrogenase [Thermomicrobium sp. 4228-Ro]MCX2727886.1 shikimate dehydrogenase [Thermomicrobium sp. 4228-Ro]
MRLGLIGYPVEHSLSPIFQQAALDAIGIPARYELWPTPPDRLADRIIMLRSPDIIGANVTVPHKEAVARAVDRLAPRAQRAGAVNTILNRDSQLIGENTDIPGFLFPLVRRSLPIADARIVVLGAGGAARAVIVALAEHGCRSLVVANRTLQRAEALVSEFGIGRALPLAPVLTDVLPATDLLVNATSIGWDGAASPIPVEWLDLLPAHALVYDLTYRETPLLIAARARNLPTLDGLEMLVAQGAESFRLWFGVDPPFEIMFQAAQEARAQRFGTNG